MYVNAENVSRYMCMHSEVSMNRQTDRQTNRKTVGQTDRQEDRRTDRQTGSQLDRPTDRHADSLPSKGSSFVYISER